MNGPGNPPAWEPTKRRGWRAQGVIRAVSAVGVELCLLSVRATVPALAVGRGPLRVISSSPPTVLRAAHARHWPCAFASLS
jgi:hypothetical protein